MAMVEVSIVPVGTDSPSVSQYVALALKVLQAEKDLKYELTAMGTILEGDLGRLLTVVRKMHQSVLDTGVKRVVTTVKIDERRDKVSSITGKVASVKEKLGNQ
ncbi:MAG: MTH1187 family thiamine-binding protein [Chloroflexi bacterium]|nr:MTH1187 family thiamine-binding protein [Chloroflexota bacterium]